YKVGIVGSGFGVSTHLPSYAAHRAFEVVALASPHRAAAVAAERSIPYAFETCRQMLSADIELDVVSVASPPLAHYHDVLAALAARKHVLCEKPMALNAAEAREMTQAAKIAGTACGIAHEFRFIPQRQALRELISNDHMGPLRNIEITELHEFLRADGDRKNNWWFTRQAGGGITGALFAHLIDASNWLAGRAPQKVCGMERTANVHRRDVCGAFTSEVADGVGALIDYGDGLISRLTCDATVRVASNTIAVHGEAQSAVASGESALEVRLFTIDQFETSELNCTPFKYAKFASVGANVPMFMALLDEFQAQIETGKSALPTFEDGLATQGVLQTVGYCV
ncbi:MAG: Gfo/Idh/MocA family oxidoreductase, partial [Candidatus Eremiobacteraeota bacterium]|nr:Gfo/Idh/MocA family oxidoreductase [Candidatus Eremiobacteraeota bacterium]